MSELNYNILNRYRSIRESSDDGQSFRIKLGAWGNASNKYANFLRDWESITKPHSANPRKRVYGDVVAVEVEKFGDAIHIGDIFSFREQNKGNGTSAIMKLCELADKHNIVLELYARNYGNEPEPETIRRLVEFYARFGFRTKFGAYSDEDGVEMMRRPIVIGGR